MQEFINFNMPVQSQATGSVFDGTTFDHLRDGVRLTRQLAAVGRLMADGNERVLLEIATAVRCSEASASARLRDLRKTKFGGHVVQRRNLGGGVWTYRLVLNGSENRYATAGGAPMSEPVSIAQVCDELLAELRPPRVRVLAGGR